MLVGDPEVTGAAQAVPEVQVSFEEAARSEARKQWGSLKQFLIAFTVSYLGSGTATSSTPFAV